MMHLTRIALFAKLISVLADPESGSESLRFESSNAANVDVQIHTNMVNVTVDSFSQRMLRKRGDTPKGVLSKAHPFVRHKSVFVKFLLLFFLTSRFSHFDCVNTAYSQQSRILLSIYNAASNTLRNNLFSFNNNETYKDLDLGEKNDEDFILNDTAFRKYANRSCQKDYSASTAAVERADLFVIDNVDLESCKTFCRHSLNCFGVEYTYDAKGADTCAIWYGIRFDVHLLDKEAKACPNKDCFIKHQSYATDKDYPNGRDNKDNKNKQAREDNDKKDILNSRDDKGQRKNTKRMRKKKQGRKNNEKHSISMIESNSRGSSSRSRSNDVNQDTHTFYRRSSYPLGFDCTNDRMGCMSGLTCLPSPLNGSDRWSCQYVT